MMKGKKKTWKHRFKQALSVVLAVLLFTSALIIAPAREAKANFLVDWAVTHILDFGLEILESSTVSALGWAASSTDNEAIDDIYKAAEYLFGDSSSTQILNECKKIEDGLKEIQDELDQLGTEIDEKMAAYATDAYCKEANTKYIKISAAAKTYTDYINKYREYIASVQALAKAQQDYEADPVLENQQKVLDAQAAVEGKKVLLNDTTDAIEALGTEDDPGGFLKAIDVIAEEACTRYPSYNANDLSPRTNATFDKDDTYIGLLNKASYTNNAFEYQHYEMMVNAVNKAVIPIANVIVAYRIYGGYRAAAGKDVTKESRYFPMAANMALNGINDMLENQCARFGDKGDFTTVSIKTAMRPYDVDVTLPLDGYQTSQSHTENLTGDINQQGNYSENLTQHTFTAHAHETKEEMDFYRVNVRGQTFLILKTPDFRITQYDITNWEKLAVKVDGHYHDQYYGYPNQDFYNLLSVGGGKYSMVKEFEDYQLILTSPANHYTNMADFLSNQGLTDITTPDMTPYKHVYVLANNWQYPLKSNAFGQAQNHYSHFHLPVTDVTRDKTPEIYEFNTENYDDQGVDKDRFSLLAIFNGDEKKLTAGVRTVVKGNGALSIDAGGYALDSVPARTNLTITAKPGDGDGRLVRLRAVSDRTGETIKEFADENVYELLKKEDGSITFGMSMPYDGVSFYADFADLQGEGTEDSPFLIYDYDTLTDCIRYYNGTSRPEVHFKVTADFDCEGRAIGYFGGKPEGDHGVRPYSGVFDGGGHTISGVSTFSLFGTVGKEGVIKNLTLHNPVFQSGAFSGYNEGTIRNCHLTGDAVRCSDTFDSPAGGLVQQNDTTGNIINCSNTAHMETGSIGGITGGNAGNIFNCYSAASYSYNSACAWYTQPPVIAGITCFHSTPGVIKNVYSTAVESGNPDVKFDALTAQNVGGKVEHSYYREPAGRNSDEPQSGIEYEGSYMTSTAFADELNEQLEPGWRSWSQSPDENNGFPVFRKPGAMRGLAVEAEHGSVTVTDQEGNTVSDTAEAGSMLDVVLAPEEGYEALGLALKNGGGETLADLALTLQSDGTSTAEFTMPDEDCILGAQFIKTHTFPTDDDGTILIPDYETLKEAAQAVRENPARYAGASYRVTNDIINVQTPENFPEWPLSIGSEAHPFTGNFDGGGFDIGGIKQDMTASGEKYGGLFGAVGPDGVVHDVHVYAFVMNGGDGQMMGAIAGLNQGTIKDCSSGSAQTSGAHYGSDVDIDDMRNLNVTVTSCDGGGIAGESSGTILNCWSGADVTGDAAKGHAGGIAGITAQGSAVSNGYAMGRIKANQSGGIVGRSYGDIVNSYFCGSTEGETSGGVAGANHHAVEHTYYIASVQKAFGSGYGDAKSMEKADMTMQAFADTLNKNVSKDMNYWAWDAKTHHGYPTLVKDPMIQRTLTDSDTGISITGTIHAAAVLDAEKLKEAHKLYEELARHVKKGEMLGVFDIKAEIPGGKSGQKTFTGSIQVTFPLAAEHRTKNIIILHKLSGGNVLMLEDVTVKDGAASAHVKELSPFAVVAGEKDGIRINNTVRTGDSSNMLAVSFLCIAALAVIAGIVLYRRRRHNHEKDR